MTTPNLQLAEPPDFASPIAAEERDSARALDALGPGVIAVLSQITTAPPGGALQGARYIVPEGATAEWTGRARHVAYLTPEGWEFRAPRVGWVALVLDETAGVGDLVFFTYSGVEWVRGTFDAAGVGFDGYAVAGLDSTNVEDAILEVYDILREVTDALDARVAVLEAAPGGGGSSGSITPDTPPTIADAMDDEFEDAFDTVKWTWRNQGTATATTNRGSLVLDQPASGPDNCSIVEQSFTGPNVFRCKVGAGMRNALSYGGIGLLDSVGGKFIGVGQFGGGRIVVRFNSVTSGNSAPYLANDADTFGPTSGFVYFEARYDGINVVFMISSTGNDGTFIPLLSEAATSFIGTAPDRVVLFANSNNVTNPLQIAYAWFRRIP